MGPVASSFSSVLPSCSSTDQNMRGEDAPTHPKTGRVPIYTLCQQQRLTDAPMWVNFQALCLGHSWILFHLVADLSYPSLLHASAVQMKPLSTEKHSFCLFSMT